MPKKRKSTSPAAGETSSKKLEQCIIHTPNINHGSYVSLSDLENSLERIEVIRNVRDRRMAEHPGSHHRMTDVCQAIPEDIDLTHGYHRGCYQRFTMNLDRLKGAKPVSMASTSEDRPKRKASLQQVLFEPDCIFCNVVGRIHVIVGGLRTTQGTHYFECDGWQRVVQLAEERKDSRLLLRIRGYDLFACEAKYHPKCRKQYTMDPSYWRSNNPENIADQFALEAAHDLAFHHVAEYIEETVVVGLKVIQLSVLRLIYISKLDETNFANPDYRADKLKKRLTNHPVLGPKVVFTKVNAKDSLPFYLVFSSSISIDDAVEQAYKLGSNDNLKDVALHLRGVILKAFNESKELLWPPPLNDLEVKEGVIPSCLQSFLSLLVSGQPTAPSCRAERMILSIGQDLCRSVTNGEWKLPKHILLCVTLHHLFRSKQLLTVLNRLGHCENYTFAMELETAIAVALEHTSSLLTPRIVRSPGNILFHSEWDNFNQILTGLHGKPAFNTSAGIMLQEATNPEEASIQANLPVIPKTKQRSLQLVAPVPLQPFYISKKKGPDMKLNSIKQPDDNTAALQNALNIYTIWVSCRTASSSGKQQVPALCGFISATGRPPKKLTTIDYYPSITEPITEYNVVKELLAKCEKATEEVGQLYTITTFDLGVVMKAMPIIWQNPVKYKNHIILIGAFHTIMNYMNMLGHKMAGSGYSEIIIEANLVTSGCLKGVLSGKKYNKSIWCLKVVSEALERLLLKAFVSHADASEYDATNVDVLDALIKDCSEEKLLAALQDCSMNQYLKAYFNFQERVRNGELGKTAKFWISFLDHSRRIFMLLYAVKVNDLHLFHKCMGDMADLFFSFGGINYSRYLTWFDLYLTNIESTHPGATQLLEKGAISVARSHTPGNLCSVDKTMEETYMKFAKSHSGSGGAGLTGILENYGAYQRWIRTTSQRSKFYQATMDMCGMNDDGDSSSSAKHREQTKSEIKRSEAAVQRVTDALNGFLNPFEVPDKSHLYILSSGAPVPADIENDVLNAEEIGRKEKEKFVKERLQKVDGNEAGKEGKDFFDKLQRMKLKTMESTNKKVKLTSAQGQIIQYKEQGNIAFQILVKSQLSSQPVSIDELMTFCITPIPHSLGTPDGYMAKTNKAKLVHYLTSDVPEASLPTSATGKTIFIEDGNATFHTMKDLPPTFKHISLKVLNQLGHKPDVIFSTDMYVKDSIKSQERLRRGCSEKIILEGVNTRKPADFKLFLQNDENKNQLFKLMGIVWSSEEAAKSLINRKVILVIQGQAFWFTSTDAQTVDKVEIESLKSDQEETDTRVILYLYYARQQGYKYAVVHSPDSDILFILLYYAQKLDPLVIFYDTGSGKHRRLLNITEIAKDLGYEFCETLLGFYCFTGEDCNCAFKGKGKINPLKKLEKWPKFQTCFSRLGDSWDLEEQLINGLEEFTCIMYGYQRVKSVNTVRALMLKKMVGNDQMIKTASKIDLSKLPPCRDSLVPHIHRANYRVAQWKHSHIPMPHIPPPVLHGWVKSEGFIQPVWSDRPVLPSHLVDILAEKHSSNEENCDDEISEDEADSDFSSAEDSD